MAASSKEAGEREPGLFVKQGSKLHAKLLSKEAAAQLAVPSFRVYYSVASAGAVPFLWESQPGTPKNDPASAAALPPLTPPPSYYTAGGRKGGGRSEKRRGAAAAIFTFLRRPGRTAPCSASSSSTSSSATSSSRSTTSTMSPVFTVRSPPPGAAGSRDRHDRRGFSAGEVDVADAAADEEARCSGTTTTSTEAHECCDRGIVKGSRVLGAVRNALATVVGGANKPAARRA